MLEPFEFKGITLRPGDTISIAARTIPMPCAQAAVVDFDPETNQLEVMSTQLAVFQHSGLFTEADVTNIQVEHAASEAVPMEARAQLAWGQSALVEVEGIGTVQATVVAAFDGIVAGITDDGQPIAGGSSFWHAA